ncbi:hypothetical protein O181_064800 [Austropuccinia psidii MF-1]|uniref:Uncharacterized protein n=1 Tax=Austropuccinia psidii MF-1 TaxID=1389203 RepID=A0A9Q3I3H2_9BASI|nr:hypothetical protein [Austropuccinia psidii MF-1]
MLNGPDSYLKYLDQNSLEAFDPNIENSSHPPDSPFKLPVGLHHSPDIKLDSTRLFLHSFPTFSLNPKFKSSPSPGSIIKEYPRSDKID